MACKKGGLNLGVAYPINSFTKQKYASLKHKPASDNGLMVWGLSHTYQALSVALRLVDLS